jgi:hypothetical protein
MRKMYTFRFTAGSILLVLRSCSSSDSAANTAPDGGGGNGESCSTAFGSINAVTDDGGRTPCDACARAHCCSQISACVTTQCINGVVCWLSPPNLAAAYGCPEVDAGPPPTGVTSNAIACLSTSCSTECK